MADFDITFNWLMDSEDPLRKYAVLIDNNGAKVVGGINAASFPADVARIEAIPQAERGTAVKEFYWTTYWDRRFQALNSDEIAKRVVDMAVNAGSHTATRLLQGAIPEADGPAVAIDGVFGLNTAAAANACNEQQLVLTFKANRVQYYKDIVEKRPSNQPYLKGWIARAKK